MGALSIWHFVFLCLCFAVVVIAFTSLAWGAYENAVPHARPIFLLITIVAIAIPLYNWGYLKPGAIPMDAVVLVLFWGAVGYGIYYWLVVRPKKQAEFEKSPEHAFKVNVSISPFKDGAVDKFIRGRKLTHRLEIDIKISQKDWKRIKDAGLYDAVLFEYPNTLDTADNSLSTFKVSTLEKPYPIGFYNIGDAEAAKEKLIESLYNLRDAIEVQKEGKRSETIEI